MAFDPIQEDCLRLILEAMRRERVYPLENALFIETCMTAFNDDPARLIVTDRDRAFHLVAKATQTIDYRFPFITDDAVDPPVSRVDLSLLPKSSEVAIARIKLLGTSVSVEPLIGESIVSVADIVDYMTVPNGKRVRTYSSDISGAALDDVLYVGHGSGTGATMRTARAAGFTGYIHSMSIEAQMNPSGTRGHIAVRLNLDPSTSFNIKDVDEEAYYIDTGIKMTIPDGWSGGYHRYDISGYSIANCDENAVSTTNWIDSCDIDISDEGKVYVRATIDTRIYSAIIIVNATISTASLREAAAL